MKRVICIFLTVMVLLSAMSVTAYAENYDLNRKGSITIRVFDGKTPLKGLKLECIRVGKLEKFSDGSYGFVRVYTGKKISSSDIYSEDFSKKMYEFYENNSKNYSFSKQTESVGSNGYLTFDGCTPGLYLILQKEDYSLKNKNYAKMNAFVVSVPYEYRYDVDATMKPALDVEPEETTPTTKPPQKLPQTGQMSWPVPVLASCGMLLFAIGWWMAFGTRKESYER